MARFEREGEQDETFLQSRTVSSALSHVSVSPERPQPRDYRESGLPPTATYSNMVFSRDHQGVYMSSSSGVTATHLQSPSSVGTIVVGHVADSSRAGAVVQHHGQDERIREPVMVVRLDDGYEDRSSGPLRGVGGRSTEPAVSRVVARPLLPSVAESPENIRTRRLRRSPNFDNLRPSSIRTNSISDLSLNGTRRNSTLFGHGNQNPAIFANPIQFLGPAHVPEPAQGLAPKPPVHGAVQNPTVQLHSPSGSVTVLQDHDVERIVRWRSTATTVDRGLTRSPISIRRFNSQEMLAWTHPNAPHVQVQHGGSIMDTGNSTSVQTAFRLPIPASGLSSPVRGEWDGGNGQGDGEVGVEADWAGPGYYGLMEMNRVQWQVHTGIYHPELNFGNVGVESDRVRRVEDPEAMKEIGTGDVGKGKEPQKDQQPDSKRASSSQAPRPILNNAQANREGEPHPPQTERRVQIAPSSSFAAVHPIMVSALKDDAQTYTTEGLSLALTKLYDPAPIPSPVITALRDPDELYTLDIQGIINSRHKNGARAKIALDQKEMDYLTYYIDYLVSEKTRLEKAVSSLEERIEDVDVEKAGLQTEINHYFGLAEAEHNKREAMKQILKLLLSHNNDGDYVGRKIQAMDLANELGVDLREVMGGTDMIGQKESARHVSNPMKTGESSKQGMAGGADKGKEPVSEAGPSMNKETRAPGSQREQLAEAEVKYWRKRTAVAEEFAKEMERVLFGTATASVLRDPMAMGGGSGAGNPREKEAEGSQREVLEAEIKYWKQRAAIAEEFVQEMEGVLFGRTTD